MLQANPRDNRRRGVDVEFRAERAEPSGSSPVYATFVGVKSDCPKERSFIHEPLGLGRFDFRFWSKRLQVRKQAKEGIYICRIPFLSHSEVDLHAIFERKDTEIRNGCNRSSGARRGGRYLRRTKGSRFESSKFPGGDIRDLVQRNGTPVTPVGEPEVWK